MEDFLISLHGLWIIENEIWIQWILIQAKMIEPIQFTNLLIDEKITHKKPIPPPPPLPIFKKSDNKIIIKKTNKMNEINNKPKFEVPSIEELQTILSNLKNINLF